MIGINGHEITMIYIRERFKRAKDMAYVYVTKEDGIPHLVWQAVRSCFGTGLWNNDKPWDNDELWNNG